MKVQFEITYPERLPELCTRDESIIIKQNNSSFDVQTELTERSTIFIITFFVECELSAITEESKQVWINIAFDLVNKCINSIRTFHHEKTSFQLVSPRFVNSVKATFSEGHEKNEEIIPIKRGMPKYLKEFFDYLNEDEHHLSLTEKLEIDQLPALHLIIDAYYSFFEGRYNECILNCATAVESIIFPELKKWLTACLYNKNEKSAEKILIEIPMALKYELLFGTVQKEYLKNQVRLLENIKKINSLRNSIIHSGASSTKKEAEKTLDQCAKLLCIIYLKMEDIEE